MGHQASSPKGGDTSGYRPTPSSQTAIKYKKPYIPQSSQATRFTCFPKLIPELRIYIWEIACFTTRIVELHVTPAGIDEENAETLKDDYGCPSPAYRVHTRMPPLLTLCKESHQVLSKYYTQPLGHPKDAKKKLVRLQNSSMDIELFGRIDINWASDILLLPHLNHLKSRGVPMKIVLMLIKLLATSSEKNFRLALEIAGHPTELYSRSYWEGYVAITLSNSMQGRLNSARHIELFFVPVNNNHENADRCLRLGNGAEELFHFRVLALRGELDQIYPYIAESSASVHEMRVGLSLRGCAITFERQETPEKPTISITGLEIALPRESFPGDDGFAVESG
ncbi:hypothetical protein GLAREA_02153 [Glarea lozoyensis ATCC 20868]|uniref:2EXR domain-containing protein n=1 Tax=Glarea lozoyensis (strain ATCC 20868 / MF5171) TaxID=1116229 RepID=S3D2H8_GLAL2|nr:uncharacterized protein GLAREA_02153 [Glarea lozoyensis ATCC 20868]EPE26241.1 hypothetical protein GLAREA_02153 [Glarea lozoyensis ATCC 20868]